MSKVWTIAWKDTVVRFRDRNALAIMLVAPLVLSAIMGGALGGLVSGTRPLADIPVAVVAEDTGELGRLVVEVLGSDRYAGLFDLETRDDLAAARAEVEQGRLRAVVHVPADFTARFHARADDPSRPRAEIGLFTDPTSTVGAPIVEQVVRRIAQGVAGLALSRQLSLARLRPEAAALALGGGRFNDVVGEEIVAVFDQPTSGRISVETFSIESGRGVWIDAIAHFAPSMAILFLLFASFDGARTILVEERDGTLGRLRSTPTSLRTILVGKACGVLLTGALQIAVLILASRALFGLHWGGSPTALVVLSASAVGAMSGLGFVVAALAGDPDRARVVGGTVAMVLAILGGNLVPVDRLPPGLETASRLTPNRWALEGFADLAVRGLDLRDVVPETVTLAAMAAVLLLSAAWLLDRRLSSRGFRVNLPAEARR